MPLVTGTVLKVTTREGVTRGDNPRAWKMVTARVLEHDDVVNVTLGDDVPLPREREEVSYRVSARNGFRGGPVEYTALAVVEAAKLKAAV